MLFVIIISLDFFLSVPLLQKCDLCIVMVYIINIFFNLQNYKFNQR